MYYVEIKYTTSNVTDATSFDSAWSGATQLFIDGTESNTTTTYSYGDYKQYSPTLSSGNYYQQIIKIIEEYS